MNSVITCCPLWLHPTPLCPALQRGCCQLPLSLLPCLQVSCLCVQGGAISGFFARNVGMLRNRMLADHRFLFKLFVEVAIDAGGPPDTGCTHGSLSCVGWSLRQAGPLPIRLLMKVALDACEGARYLRTQLQRLLQHTKPMPASCSSCLLRWPWRPVRGQ